MRNGKSGLVKYIAHTDCAGVCKTQIWVACSEIYIELYFSAYPFTNPNHISIAKDILELCPSECKCWPF